MAYLIVAIIVLIVFGLMFIFDNVEDNNEYVIKYQNGCEILYYAGNVNCRVKGEGWSPSKNHPLVRVFNKREGLKQCYYLSCILLSDAPSYITITLEQLND